MNARKQLIVVLAALMLVCSSGAMAVAAVPAATVDEHDTNATADDDPADDTETDAEPDNETESAEQQDANVTFEDQATDGETVVVDEVSMASGGFVTIHDSSLLAGDALGSVVGVSTFLEAGAHEDVEVTLDEPLEENETLIAMPHRDTNDNQTYDFVETEGEEDGPYLTADGEAVTDEAVVTVDEAPEESPDEKPAEEPAEDEPVEDQPVEEESEAVDDEAITIVIEQATIVVVDEQPTEGPDGTMSNGDEDGLEEDDTDKAVPSLVGVI